MYYTTNKSIKQYDEFFVALPDAQASFILIILANLNIILYAFQDLMLNYSVLCDKKIRAGQTVTVKICYHEECVVSGIFSAIISIGLIDDNNHIWIQPLFAPEEKIYDSNLISAEEYRGYIKTEKAEECFRKPYLW